MLPKPNDGPSTLLEFFDELEDPRLDRKKRHLLTDIIIIAILAVISGSTGWSDMEVFGNCREEWLRQFLALPNGIPSHDTFGRVFSLIDLVKFQTCFINWTNSLRSYFSKEVIAVDGKCLRRSFSSAEANNPIHIVSAWSSKNRLVLGQVKVDDKSNEITAIPQLLQSLWMKGCIITIDAMGCQKQIAGDIINGKADYVLAVKGNQENLYNQIKSHFDQTAEIVHPTHEIYRTEESAHGRKEIREYHVFHDIRWLESEEQWPGLKAVGAACSIRQTQKTETNEIRFYIMSKTFSAKEFSSAVRQHWGIENKVHWVLDVAFREDDCRIRNKNAPANMAVLRHVAMNIMRMETSTKRGFKGKQLKAAWSLDYLEKILNIGKF